jgi:hypothetical protein
MLFEVRRRRQAEHSARLLPLLLAFGWATTLNYCTTDCARRQMLIALTRNSPASPLRQLIFCGKLRCSVLGQYRMCRGHCGQDHALHRGARLHGKLSHIGSPNFSTAPSKGKELLFLCALHNADNGKTLAFPRDIACMPASIRVSL